MQATLSKAGHVLMAKAAQKQLLKDKARGLWSLVMQSRMSREYHLAMAREQQPTPYDAGFKARHDGQPLVEAMCDDWRAGWRDADSNLAFVAKEEAATLTVDETLAVIAARRDQQPQKTVIDVKEVDLTTTATATLKRRFYGLLFDKRFWDELAAENPRITVTLRGVMRCRRYIVQLVVTETLKPLPHEL